MIVVTDSLKFRESSSGPWQKLLIQAKVDFNIILSSSFSIPSPGSSVSYNMEDITSDYSLIKWNFSLSPENKPPADLTWATYDGYFTITNNGGTTSETITPMFAKGKAAAISSH